MGNHTNNTKHTNNLRVMLEIGLRGKRVVAVAPDWPGLERGAATEQAAVSGALADCARRDSNCQVIAIGPFSVGPN